MDCMSRAGRGITRHKKDSSATNVGLTLEDLKIVSDGRDSPDTDMQGDSDDESDETDDNKPLDKGGDDEMMLTAINLLLSILEGNSRSSAFVDKSTDSL